MSLQAGARLGPYEIVSPLGAGGMGEVYRARDARLDRDVAIKVLPRSTSALPDARERLTREARALSRLSHPHICGVYDVGDDGGRVFVVMELLEGETLASRLARGPLSLTETRRVGGEIAEALGAAHRQGIVHRDLKPGNVMLTPGGVKLLDFGLAKAVVPSDAESAPTLGRSLTMEGTVVGTLQYMSPEQMEGKPADTRSDVFALGAVLYEMAAGRRAFAGDTASIIAAAILTADPPPLAGAPVLDRIVRACLAKDPDRRWQSAQDVALQLAMNGDTSSVVPVRPRTWMPAWVPWGVVGLATVVALFAVWLMTSADDRPAAAGAPRPVAFTVPPPPGLSFPTSVERVPFAVSPDGTMLAFAAGSAEGGTTLWVRPMASVGARPLAGTEGAQSPFWSPDSRAIGFFVRGKLRQIPIAGGAPVTICDVREDIGITGSWGAGGQILFASAQGEGIFRVSTSGGAPAIEVAPDIANGETRVVWPAFLPDGRRYLYTVTARDDKSEVRLGEPGRPFRTVLAARSNARYVEPGYLLYVDEGSLLARRFDATAGTVSGDAIPVAAEVKHFRATAGAMFAASASGVVVFTDGADRSRLAWFDRAGRDVGEVRSPDGYLSLRISRDGREALFERAARRTTDYDLWSLDLSKGVETRLTSSLDTEIAPQFGPPGTVIYSASRGAAPRLTRRDLASGVDERMTPEAAPFQIAADVSADGTWVLYTERAGRGNFDIHALPLNGGPPVPIATTAFNEIQPSFSADGRLIAFVSDDTGRPEVYVTPLAAPRSKRRVSMMGGTLPRWDRARRELVYLAPDNRVMAMPIGTGASPEFGTPAPLFMLPKDVTWSAYDIAPDGRFLAIVPVQFASRQPLTVLVNWPATLPR